MNTWIVPPIATAVAAVYLVLAYDLPFERAFVCGCLWGIVVALSLIAEKR